MFRTARYHCKFAQRWSEKTDIPDIPLPRHRQDGLRPQVFFVTSGEREMVNVHYKHLPDVLCLELGVKIPRSDFVISFGFL